MILVDSSVWIDYFRGKATRQTELLEHYLTRERLATGDLILAEVFQGIQSKQELALVEEYFQLLLYFDMVGKKIALKAAENNRLLRQKGYTVRKTIDVLIGTFCIENSISLLHNDRDFEPMELMLGLSAVR